MRRCDNTEILLCVPVGDRVLPAGFVGVTEGSEVCPADQWVGQGVGGARESSTAHTQILPQSVQVPNCIEKHYYTL